MKIKVFWIWFLMSLYVPVLFAVTLKLKNGTTVSGKQLELGSSYIVIDFYGVDVRYDFNRLYSIDDVSPKDYMDFSDNTFKKDADILEKEGVEYSINGDFLTAKELFIKAISIGGNEADLKDSLQVLRDYKKGLLAKAAVRNVFLAKHYLSLGEYSQAISQYQAVAKITPSYSYTYAKIAKIYLYLRDIDLALRYFEKALGKNKNDPELLASLGMLYFYFARITEAKRHFLRAKDLFNEKGAFSDAEAISQTLTAL